MAPIKIRKEHAGYALLLIVLGAFLAVMVWRVFSDFDASAMSIHGWVALGIGTVSSLVVGIGLMALVFYSARHGYDDPITREEPEDGRRGSQDD